MELLDPRDVPLDDGIDVVEVPVLPTCPGGTLKRLGIAAGEHRCDEDVPDHNLADGRHLAPESLLEKVRQRAGRSLRESGSNRTTSMRPASKSATRGRIIRLAEPGSRGSPKRRMIEYPRDPRPLRRSS